MFFHSSIPAIKAKLDVRYLHIALLLITFLLAAISQSQVCCGQFAGEDEAIQLWYSSRMIDGLRHLDLSLITAGLTEPHHPPLRFILSIPGLILFPNTEYGLRLVALALSFVLTYQIIKLGKEIGGDTVGYASGILIAVSGIYNWTSMAFAWSVIVLALILSVRRLRSCSLNLAQREGRRSFALINLLIIAAFVTNTGAILFFPPTLFIFWMENRRRFPKLLRLSLPYVTFYELYYLFYFIVLPRLDGDAGQYEQHLLRAQLSRPNYDSFLANLRGVNTYFLPYVALVILACGVVYLIRHEPKIALWFAPFTLAWSFIFLRDTDQYFILVSICILPFGLRVLREKLDPKAFVGLIVLLGMLMFVWNAQLFLRDYGSADPAYPDRWLDLGSAKVSRAHNISEPYAAIGSDIDRLLEDGKSFIHDGSGSFSMFYYKDDPEAFDHSRYGGRFGSDPYFYEYDSGGECYRLTGDEYDDVQIVVTDRRLCPNQVALTIDYGSSTLHLYTLSLNPR